MHVITVLALYQHTKVWDRLLPQLLYSFGEYRSYHEQEQIRNTRKDDQHRSQTGSKNDKFYIVRKIIIELMGLQGFLFCKLRVYVDIFCLRPGKAWEMCVKATNCNLFSHNIISEPSGLEISRILSILNHFWFEMLISGHLSV